MSRYTRARPGDEEEPSQLDHAAFTLKGWSIVHHLEADRKRYQEINVNSNGKTGVSTTRWLTELGSKPNEEKKAMSSISFTQRELGGPETDIARFMVVGLALDQDQLNKSSMDLKDTVGKRIIGQTLPDNQHYLHRKGNTPVYYVVSPIKSGQQQASFGVLLNPSRGLRQAYVIKQDDVFFFDEFRDESTNINDRRGGWSAKVLEQVNHNVGELPATEKQQRFKRARDQTKLILEPKVSFANELLLLTALWKEFKQPWVLQEMVDLIEMVETQPGCKKAANEIMNKFLNFEEQFTMEDAEGMSMEYLEMWPESGETVDPDYLVYLRSAISKSELDFEQQDLRGFIAQGMYELRSAGSEEIKRWQPQEWQSLVKRTHDIAKLHEPFAYKSMPSIPADHDNAILKALYVKLREIKAASSDFDHKLKEQFGDAAVVGSSTDVWANYANSCDVDQSKVMFNGMARFMAARMKQSSKSTGDQIALLTDMMEKAGLQQQEEEE